MMDFAALYPSYDHDAGRVAAFLQAILGRRGSAVARIERSEIRERLGHTGNACECLSAAPGFAALNPGYKDT